MTSINASAGSTGEGKLRLVRIISNLVKKPMVREIGILLYIFNDQGISRYQVIQQLPFKWFHPRIPIHYPHSNGLFD